MNVEFQLYKTDFNIIRNFGVLNRILGALAIPVLFLGYVFLIPTRSEISPLIILVLVFGSILISEYYIRKLLPDWPKQKLFVGTITFYENQIMVNSDLKNMELQLRECSEMILFYDHYIGYTASSRDIRRNGNGLLYYKNRDEEISIFKFNISDEEQYDEFKIVTENYKNELPYFKEYLPSEISHILKSDYSDRFRY